MQLCELGEGFNLVPMSETNVTHNLHTRKQLRWDGRNAPVCNWERKSIARNTDAMAIQATMILRDVLRSIHTGDFDND